MICPARNLRKINDVKPVAGIGNNGWIGLSMPIHDQAIPVKQEVQHQLERMLGSELFRARPQQSKVFEFIVRAALAGREISEKDIRARFFPTPPYDPESTVARTTVNFIRSKLVPQ